MRTQSTQAEIEYRIKEIVDKIISGCSHLQILELADTWGVTQRTVCNYLKRAKQIIIETNKTDIAEESAKLRHRYELLFNMALENQDLRAATLILNQQSKMFGISEPQTDNSKDTTLIISHQFVSGNGSVLPSNAFVDNGDGSDSEMDFSI